MSQPNNNRGATSLDNLEVIKNSTKSPFDTKKDPKLTMLIEILHNKGVLSTQEVEYLEQL